MSRLPPLIGVLKNNVVGVGGATVTAVSALLYYTSYLNPATALISATTGILVAGGSTLRCRRAESSEQDSSRVQVAQNDPASTTVADSDYILSGKVTSSEPDFNSGNVRFTENLNLRVPPNGKFKFKRSALGAETLTPELKHYTFTPPSITGLGPDNRNNCDFTASLVEYAIRGKVLFGSVALQDVQMTFSDDAIDDPLTDDNGRYELKAKATGSYTLTPSREHYVFEPSSRHIHSLLGDSDVQFKAMRMYRIHGCITLDNGKSLKGITVKIKEKETTTGPEGRYEFSMPALKKYTVNVSSPFYDFKPSKQIIDNLDVDTEHDFTATAKKISLSCKLHENGKPLNNIDIEIAGDSDHHYGSTNAQGMLEVQITAGENYNVCATSPHFTFETKEVNAPSADKTVKLNATRILRTIRGRVLDNNGAGIADVTLRCSLFAPARLVQTTKDGHFIFSDVPSGNMGNVSINDGHFNNVPFVAIPEIGANVENVDFTLTRQRFSIAGTLTINGAPSGMGINVALLRNGIRLADAQTIADGSYNFGMQDSNTDYEVRPTRTAILTFNPFRRQIDLLRNCADVDFAGTRLSGRDLIVGAKRIVLTDHALDDVAGRRLLGRDIHTIPLDVLAAAAKHALTHKPDDGKTAYFYPIQGSAHFLAFIMSENGELITCYEVSQAQALKDIRDRGQAFVDAVLNRRPLRHFVGGEDL